MSDKHKVFLTSIDSKVDPTTFYQAFKALEWREVMSAEILALERNNTWTVTTLPHGKQPIGCKWFIRLSINQMEPLRDIKQV